MQSQLPECSGKIGVLGIRREDKSKWERRVVITPEHVAQVLKANKDIKVIVQPSKNRVFRDVEYQQAGAEINEDLSEAAIIFGVKEVPIDKIFPNKTHVYFSHTIKAQEANMDALDSILAKKTRLIDYEKICDAENKRLVAFGKFAGNTGAIDFLHGIGKYFINLGYSTPFLNVSFAYSYPCLEKAKVSIKDIGTQIANGGIPQDFAPLVYAITSKGRCSTGVYEILECLPHKIVDPNDLAKLVADKSNPEHLNQIYITYIEGEHMVTPKDSGKSYDKKDYYSNPHTYKPIFHEKYLPYISVLYHCMYWDPKFPRLITCDQMKDLTLEKNSRLIGISDITCDLDGSIEFLRHETVIDKPFFIYDPINDTESYDCLAPTNNILYHAVDHMPTELAFDASTHFSNKLFPFLEKMALSDMTKPLAEQGLPDEIARAVITWNGELTPKFKYIADMRRVNEETKKMKHHQREKPDLKKNTSFTTLKIQGHLFDTQGINAIFDKFEHFGIKFRVLEMNIGQNTEEDTSAFVQVFSKDPKNFNAAIEEVYDVAEKHKIDVSE
jgi:alpha-aminoadipic semialdehyde synthase